MITIINYGLGNIQAFVNVYRRLHIPVCVATNAEELKGASRLILPGVGAFDHAIEKLDASGMRPALEHMVREQRVPVLGSVLACRFSPAAVMKVSYLALVGSLDESRDLLRFPISKDCLSLIWDGMTCSR